MAEEKEKNNCSVIVDSLLKGLDGVLATKTVVGEATTVGDTIIIPLVDVSFGIGAGASLGKNASGSDKGGGGGGLSGKMTPSAVLVIKDGVARLVNIKNQDAVTKIIDMVPEIFDKVSTLIGKKNSVSDEEAVEAAFPDDEED